MITIYDNGGRTVDRYTVYLGQEVYLMSDNADMPNGVCMYVGPVADGNAEGKPISLDQAPEGVRRQVERLQKEG